MPFNKDESNDAIKELEYHSVTLNSNPTDSEVAEVNRFLRRLVSILRKWNK